MYINSRKEAGLVNPETGEYLELDIYMPSLNLAFEYQERHHYTDSNSFQPSSIIQQRDRVKKELTLAKGITLIAIPCWWNGAKERLLNFLFISLISVLS
jgi:hypothetical protein